MNRMSRYLAAAAAATFFSMGLAACHHGYVEVSNTPVATGYYDYEYYPDSEVYYYPTEHVYYWRDHDRWEHGRDLPGHIRVDRDSHVALRLNTARPYDQHARIVREHPGHHVAGER
jgi:hypothetical protein